jgi:RNA polymerase-binding transcription factor DksA
MPAKTQSSGKKPAAPAKKAKPAAAKSSPQKATPKAAVKAVSKSPGKSVVKPLSPKKTAKAAKGNKAPAPISKKSVKAPGKSAVPAAKPKSKATPKKSAAAPKTSPIAAKATPKPTVKESKNTKPKAPAKPAAKTKPAPKAAAKPATKAKPAPKAAAKPAAKAKPEPKATAKPAAKAKPEPKAKPAPKAEPKPAAKEKPAKTKKAAKQPSVGTGTSIEAPPATKRKPKDALPPPGTLGRMPRIGVSDEPEITIEPVKGPVKMTAFLIKQQKRLIDLRDSYLTAIEGVSNETIRQRPEDGAGSAFGMHQADAGSDSYDRDFALSLLGKEQDALYEINAALKRIEQGVYGICEMSGEKISHERLEALPFTRYTVACQERIERQQMGGRWNRPSRTSVFGLDDASETSADASEDDDTDSLDSTRD